MKKLIFLLFLFTLPLIVADLPVVTLSEENGQSITIITNGTDTDTNASTACAGAEIFLGNGTCSVGTFLQGSGIDTNASNCAGAAEILLGNGTCSAGTFLGAGAETDPVWTGNWTAFNVSWGSVFNASYYLFSNPYSFFNATNPSPDTNVTTACVGAQIWLGNGTCSSGAFLGTGGVVDTNATTECGGATFLLGNGTCTTGYFVDTDTNISDTTIPDTNVTTACVGAQVWLGNGTCSAGTFLAGLIVDTNASVGCAGATVLLGNGTCSTGYFIDTDTNISDTTIPDTNVTTACVGAQVWLGNGTCSAGTFLGGGGGIDTNASTACANNEVLLGDDSCYDLGFIQNSTNVTNHSIYAQLSDLTDQSFAVAGLHYPINLSTEDEIYGLVHNTGVNNSQVTIVVSGVYTILAQPQVTAGPGDSGNFHMWMERDNNNGTGFTNVSHSNVELILASSDEDVIPLIVTISLNESDKIRVMASVSDNGIFLDTQSPAGEPIIPSVIFSMFITGPTDFTDTTIPDTNETSFIINFTSTNCTGTNKVSGMFVNGTVFCTVDTGGADTNATTECAGATVLLGNGTCSAGTFIDTDTNISDTTIPDTNVTTACAGAQVWLGNGTCSAGTFLAGLVVDTNASTACNGNESLLGNGTCTDLTIMLEEDIHCVEHDGDFLTCNGEELDVDANGVCAYCGWDADTNASTGCDGTTTYLDGDNNCDDISLVYYDLGNSYSFFNATNPSPDTNISDTNETSFIINFTSTNCTGTDKVSGMFVNGTVLCSVDSGGTEVDPVWEANWTSFNTSWGSTQNDSYYLQSNPYSFFNATNPSPDTNISDTNETSFIINFTSTNCTGTNKVSGMFSNGTVLCSVDTGGTEVDPTWTGNWSSFNASWGSTFNSTYDSWAYNQTSSALAIILSFGHYNSTDFSIVDYYPISNPYSFFNATNPSPDTNASSSCDNQDVLLGNGTCSVGTFLAGSIVDTNASVGCAGAEVLLGNGTCSAGTFIDTDTNITDTNETSFIINFTSTNCTGTNKVSGMFSNGTVFCTTDIGGTEVDPTWTGNWSSFNASWGSTYNATYDSWAYNQTSSALAIILSFNHYNATDFSIASYYPIANPYSFFNATNPSPDTNASISCDNQDVLLGNGTCSVGTFLAGSITDTNASIGCDNQDVLLGNGTCSVGNFLANFFTETDPICSAFNYYNATNPQPNTFSYYNVTTPQPNTFSYYNASSLPTDVYVNQSGDDMTGILNMTDQNITMTGGGEMYANSTCIMIKGDTATLEIC